MTFSLKIKEEALRQMGLIFNHENAC